MTIRALIVDDEAPARDELAYLLQAHPDVVSAQAATAREALEVIGQGRVDLVFQDIQMPGEDGFHVLAGAQSLDHPPLFVFVTAFDQHAIRAFEENAADYLLKPVSPERLAKSLERVRRHMGEPAAPHLSEAIERLLSTAGHAGHKPLARLAVEHGGRISLIPTAKVVLIEAEEKRVMAVTDTGRLPCHGISTLAKACERLAGLPFFQANRAQVINLERIAEFAPWFGGKYSVVMADPARTEVTVSRNRVRDFKASLGIA
ncbi:LytR/AlgR family response regulator transcription factor [Fundidesulfovibrio terrae]|uniref:LytR/AlgR family response regulator transcription factor n=1 Tax=Fundidesulfovibrio terrae TaxID=2922866 RepID=UPI001FAE8536|nr:response regulator [Fundidesulfovibrio terrae]